MKQVISASRRTDMPAWYIDRLTDNISRGFAEVPNPYSGKTVRVDLTPDSVHTIVLWSKNFERFLQKRDLFSDYHLYFLFTINDMPELEPSVPPLSERIAQMHELADVFGPEHIAWRFDPVVFRKDGFVSTVESYLAIGSEIAKAGVRRSIFSFLDMYGKVEKRNRLFGLNLVDPSEPVKVRFSRKLVLAAQSLGLSLESCCETIVSVEGIKPSACIDGRLLSRLAGEPVSLSKDNGQRKACNCTVSRDIGSYRDMPCHSGCLYCYANPVTEKREEIPGPKKAVAGQRK